MISLMTRRNLTLGDIGVTDASTFPPNPTPPFYHFSIPFYGASQTPSPDMFPFSLLPLASDSNPLNPSLSPSPSIQVNPSTSLPLPCMSVHPLLVFFDWPISWRGSLCGATVHRIGRGVILKLPQERRNEGGELNQAWSLEEIRPIHDGPIP